MATHPQQPQQPNLKLAPLPHLEHDIKHVAPQEDGESNWLVSYADLMTLLFGFFVLVSAFSTPDVAKLERLKRATAEALDYEYVEPNQGLAESLAAVLRDFNLEDEVKIISTEDGLSLVSAGTLFFVSGSVDLRPEARDLLERVADVLVDRAAKDFKIFVEGHTDDAPIRTSRFPSNWELSAVRSGTVVRLFEERGFPHEHMRPLGLADVEPIVPNRNVAGVGIEANRARNRRIVIRLQKILVPRDNRTPGTKLVPPRETAEEAAKKKSKH